MKEAAFLQAYAMKGAYTDCYCMSVAGSYSLPPFIEAVYTSPLFKLERWVLATLLKLPSTDPQARELALGQRNRFAAWKVEQRSDREILLDAGQTRLWLCVTAEHSADGPSTTLQFGSAVVPLRPGGRFGFAFHALHGFHHVYSKMLLAAAAKRLPAVARAQQAA